MKQVLGAFVLLTALAAAAFAQQPPVPQPYPRVAPPPAAQKPTEQAQAPGAPANPAAVQAGEAPSEATLGVPIYPSAQFITSYDAGRGQRFYLFGTTGGFADVVAYYKSVLKQKGDLVFEEPPTQMFDIGRFREDTMAFPPSITVKDYTWGGMQGYMNPKTGAEPARFPTIVQVVPIPAAPTPGRD